MLTPLEFSLVTLTPPDPNIIVYELVLSTALCCVGQTICWLLTPKDAKDRVHLADLYFSCLWAPTLSFTAFKATHELNQSGVEGRWNGGSYTAYIFLLVYIGGNFAHIPVTILKKQTTLYKLQMFLHHAVSVACGIRGLFRGGGHFYASLSGCCELSTVFLNNLLLFKEWQVDKRLQAVNGVLLWFSFLILRLVLFGYWLYLYFTESAAYPDITGYNKLEAYEKVLYPGSVMILTGFSVKWFISITKGMIKTLTHGQDKAYKAASEELRTRKED
ncbi:hypothetical protein CYMTET_8154 [Cymbomonas tetramitiformis]|uniref:TLC domain-containing protein n=1 Tax=Cymbomonas tetramitiformis TaxID=36881 RepID=A0AAE0GTL5_9CHLO|nr:hypothetical protein CYMTET_8154 [Cymbomonas tetramitiformis]|eukprot:gene24672-30021_t